VGLRGRGGRNVEGLEVDARAAERNAPGLRAQRRDAAARQLQAHLLGLVLQEGWVEGLPLLVRLGPRQGTALSCWPHPSPLQAVASGVSLAWWCWSSCARLLDTDMQ
jgi:hypothetical protein